MIRLSLLAITCGIVLGFSAKSAGAVPGTMAFTARITDDNGAVTGKMELVLRIYDAVQGGTLQWEETHSAVDADNGLVYVEVGADSGNQLDEQVFSGGKMFLEITANGDVQHPRVPILSVPYAIRSATCDTLGDLEPSDVAPVTALDDVLPKGSTLTCEGTEKMTGIDAVTGDVSCAADEIGSYTAGDGLDLSSGTFSVDPTDFNGSAPAADAYANDEVIATETLTHTLRSVDVTVGGAGVVTVIGKAEVSCMGTSCTADGDYVTGYMTVSDSASAAANNGNHSYFRVSRAAGVMDLFSVVAMDTFPVPAAGTYTFYLRGRRNLGSPELRFFKSTIVAFFSAN